MTDLVKDEILDHLDTGYTRLQATLSKLTPEQMLEPDVVGFWSVKDVIAHLVFWNRYPVMELQRALEGKPFEFDHSDPDAINARAVAAYEHRSLQETQADFAASFQEVVQAIQALADEDFRPESDLERRLDDSVAGVFSNNTWEHYALHREQIEAWMNKKGIAGV